MDYVELFKGLDGAGVDYLVSGAVALNLHGVPRMTYDIDLIVDLREENFLEAVRLLLRWGYRFGGAGDPEEGARPEARRRWIDEGLRELSFANETFAVGQVNVALDPPAPFEEMRARAVSVSLHGLAVPVVSVADLAAGKRRMDSAVDRQDLAALDILQALREGREAEYEPDPRVEQMKKYLQWPVENRIEWLVTSSQLRQQSHIGAPGGKGHSGRKGIKRKRIPGLRHTDLS